MKILPISRIRIGLKWKNNDEEIYIIVKEGWNRWYLNNGSWSISKSALSERLKDGRAKILGYENITSKSL